MRPWMNSDTEALCRAMLSLETVEECCAFLEDICTVKEIMDLSQRLAVAGMLARGHSYTAIRGETGASSATICRVKKCYEYGAGGYRTVLERTAEEEQ